MRARPIRILKVEENDAPLNGGTEKSEERNPYREEQIEVSETTSRRWIDHRDHSIHRLICLA